MGHGVPGDNRLQNITNNPKNIARSANTGCSSWKYTVPNSFYVMGMS